MKSQLTVRISEKLDQEISVLAKRLHLKRSDIVRMALEKLVAEFEVKSEQSPYERVKKLVGLVESGIPDLGEAHRKHLKAKIKR